MNKTITAKELADRLDGRQYMNEITAEEETAAKDAGLVVVFGYSDDNMEFRGAIDDEVGCYDGGTAFVTRDGVLNEPDCGDGDCPYFATAKKASKEIEALWCAEPNGPAWTYKTDIPHDTFEIMEDGEVRCRGIVFSVEDLK